MNNISVTKIKHQSLPDIKNKDSFYVKRKNSIHHYFATYHQTTKTEDDEEVVDKEWFNVFSKTTGIFYQTFSKEDFHKYFEIVHESINDESISKCHFISHDENYNFNVCGYFEDSTNTDDKSFHHMVESTRYQSFIEKIKKSECGKYIKYHSYHNKLQCQLTVFMKIDNFIVNEEKGYPTLSACGKSIQIGTANTNFGETTSVLTGNEYSFINLGSIDAIMYQRKQKCLEYKLYDEVTKDDCQKFLKDTYDKQIKYLQEIFND